MKNKLKNKNLQKDFQKNLLAPDLLLAPTHLLRPQLPRPLKRSQNALTSAQEKKKQKKD